MPTGARKRRYVDMGRLREALAGPGADTRVWLATARVDDDADAVRYDPGLGWIVDVTFQGGTLHGTGPVACRLGTSFAASGATRSDPIAQDCEVVVAIPAGNPNGAPAVVAQLHNEDGCEVPATVGGLPITEISAKVLHLLQTPHGALEEYGGERRVQAEGHVLLGAAVLTALQVVSTVPPVAPDGTTPPPITTAEPVLLGDSYSAAEADFLDALQTWTQAVSSALQSVGAPLGAAQGTFETALTAFQAATAAALSKLLSTE